MVMLAQGLPSRLAIALEKCPSSLLLGFTLKFHIILMACLIKGRISMRLLDCMHRPFCLSDSL